MTLRLRPAAALALSLALALALPALAKGPALDLPALSPEQVEEYGKQSSLASDAASEKDWTKAVRAYQRALRIHGGDEGTWYNLACAQALSGKADAAMASLRSALANGWRDAAWPTKDTDLASLQERADFKAWIDEVAKAAPAAAAAKAPEAADLGGSAEEIDALAKEADDRLGAVSPVLGGREQQAAMNAISTWKAASWDAVGAVATEDKDRSAAAWNALKSFLRRDLTPRSPDLGPEVAKRGDALAAAWPAAEEAPAARYAAATARYYQSFGKDDEATKTARTAYTDELLHVAATAADGPGLERTLAQLVNLHADDLSAARGFHERLRRVTNDDKRFTETMLSEARGVHYRLAGLPEFKATTLDGRAVSPADLTGKVTLLDFWATWCGPCRAELPHLKAAYAKFRDQGFEIVGISLDKGKDADATAFKAWCAENDVTWPQVFDGKFWESELAKTFGVKSIPFALLVGKDGKVAFADDQLRGEQLLERIEGVLSAPSSM